VNLVHNYFMISPHDEVMCHLGLFVCLYVWSAGLLLWIFVKFWVGVTTGSQLNFWRWSEYKCRSRNFYHFQSLHTMKVLFISYVLFIVCQIYVL